MKNKAVIDRFEDDNAILIVGKNEAVYVVATASLPHGAVEGLWLMVEVEDNRVINAIIDEEETTKVKERLARFKREGKIADNPKD
jgi:hypothetical protein